MKQTTLLASEDRARLMLHEAAHEFERRPASWCQRFQARDKLGCYTTAGHSKAVQWCALGMLARLARADIDAYREARRLLHRQACPGLIFIPKWHDAPTTTVQDVIEAMRKASCGF